MRQRIAIDSTINSAIGSTIDRSERPANAGRFVLADQPSRHR
jgi:hypothetical protein